MVSICFILSTFLYLISFISSTQSVNVDNINRSSDQPRIESENSDHTRDYLKKINKLTIQSPAKKNVLRARSLQTSVTTNNKKPVFGYAAYLELEGGRIYYGVEAIMDVWAPHVDNSNETSESLIQLRIENSAYGPNYSFISVGWQVNPKLYGDNATRLTIVWEKYRSSDDNSTYCYNVMCKPGFFQTNNTIRLGDKFSTISSYGEKGRHFAFPVSVYKDSQTKDWWLEVNKIAVGYWPSQLFSDNKNDTATWVRLGGQVTTTTTNPTTPPTTPQMGSGHFPKEGYGKAACFQAIQVYSSMDRKDPEKPLYSLHSDYSNIVKTNPKCYDLEFGTDKALGNYFYYGGPGGNKSSCE